MLKKCPVAQHRWFEKGAGWAYDHAMDGRMPQLSVVLDAELKKPVTPHESIAFCHRAFGGWIVGERVADPAPPDKKAISRGGAFVLRVALLDQPDEPASGVQAEIREKLRRQPTPLRGKQDLVIEVGKEDPPVAEPVTEASPAHQEEPRTTPPLPWFALALFACGCGLVGLPLLGGELPGNLRMAALVAPALGGVLVCLAVGDLRRYLVGPAEDTRLLARSLEEKWSGVSLSPVRNVVGIIAKEWVGLVAGDRVTDHSNGAMLARFPPIDVGERETLVQANESKLVVQGRAAYLQGSYARPAGVWLHVYCKAGDIWQMVLCAEITEPAPVRPVATIDCINGTVGAPALAVKHPEECPYPITGYEPGTRARTQDQ